MSNNFFIFKTKSGQYIGNYLNPDDDELMHGLEYQTQPKGTVLHKIKDENGDNLMLIENPSANIDTLRCFHEAYTNVTEGVKLQMSDSKFSKSVAKLISESKDGSDKKTPAKKTPAKKTSAKKTSAKKTSAKKGGAKKKSAKKTPAKKKSAKKK